MPKRTDIKSILIIGAGPIVIGQACEFDYSGTQACKALKEEGYRVILVNSNPATIMTDPGLADATYIEPITPEVVAKIIEKERPDALLPTMGGQTALNTALSLEAHGRARALRRRDDRRQARGHRHGRGPQAVPRGDGPHRAGDPALVPRQRHRDQGHRPQVARERARLASSRATTRRGTRRAGEHLAGRIRPQAALHEPCHGPGRQALDEIGLPAIIRPVLHLGGTGGGIAYNREEFERDAERGLDASPTTEVLIDESVLGWKEYEMEVVRDRADNCIIICSIENVDPMGVHTGDSITVAPALTLTDKEYQIMRNASIAVLREIGVETGGSNVQFAVNPEDGRMVVIEMNPRVSRSSALASKATGFPIAKVAAKLAVGYTLDELDNDITGGATPASFEPTIDYVVTKIPRFAFEKFPGAEPR
jgi:carbamoyl-phosphate synthase large subunit